MGRKGLGGGSAVTVGSTQSLREGEALPGWLAGIRKMNGSSLVIVHCLGCMKTSRWHMQNRRHQWCFKGRQADFTPGGPSVLSTKETSWLKQRLLPADQLPSTDGNTPAVSPDVCAISLPGAAEAEPGVATRKPVLCVTLRPWGVFSPALWRLNNFTSLFLWLSEDLEVCPRVHVLLENR